MTFNYVFLIDQECVMCNRVSSLISYFDKNLDIRYYPLQGSAAKRILEKVGCQKGKYSTSILVDRNSYYIKSAAFFELCRVSTYPMKLLYAFCFSRYLGADLLYDLIGTLRYKFFGRQEAICNISSKTDVNLIITDKELHEYLDKFNW
ncbi:thiol-disulfide oxidoreductase DCC family protein [Vibrio bivalvicida]|uniref:DUF393 domain-containing protein n=1 Tax=Vibrio bivalvicida TaxID=1276888 RepID=A0ABV4MP91_9VIBR